MCLLHETTGATSSYACGALCMSTANGCAKSAHTSAHSHSRYGFTARNAISVLQKSADYMHDHSRAAVRAGRGTRLRSMRLWWTTGRITECQRADQRSSGCGSLVDSLLLVQPPMSACSMGQALVKPCIVNMSYTCMPSAQHSCRLSERVYQQADACDPSMTCMLQQRLCKPSGTGWRQTVAGHIFTH